MNAATKPSYERTLDELICEIADLSHQHLPQAPKGDSFLSFEVFDALRMRIFIHERTNAPGYLEPGEGIAQIQKEVSGGVMLADGTVKVSSQHGGSRLIYAEWQSGWHITVLTGGIHSPYQVRSIDDWASRVGCLVDAKAIAAAYKSRHHTGATTMTAFEYLERTHHQLVKDSRPHGLHDPVIHFI